MKFHISHKSSKYGMYPKTFLCKIIILFKFVAATKIIAIIMNAKYMLIMLRLQQLLNCSMYSNATFDCANLGYVFKL